MKTYIVDAFTKQPFKGNPAAVCFPDKKLSDEQMLQIAAEFCLSETAFVCRTDKPGVFTIRYFSPKKEIPLCGHATLASAKVIFKQEETDEIHFITVQNIDLTVKQKAGDICMEFPVYDTNNVSAPAAILAALGIAHVVNTAYSPNNKIIIVEIEDSDILAALKPDFNALVNSYQNINGVLVTAPSKNKEYDYQYRYFWPWAGTNEDPVTGGVQTFLAKYWSVRLNKTSMQAFQCSQRTGYMKVELQNEKVILTSQAVVLLEGNFLAD